MFSLAPVADEDFESMLALRIDALRESLERLGRFDPQRARERLAGRFDATTMQHLVRERSGGPERIGFITLRPAPDALRVEHLYVHPDAQGRGAGSWAIAQAKARARRTGSDLTLAALKLSPANRFYLRHGFEPVDEGEFDITYRWRCEAAA